MKKLIKIQEVAKLGGLSIQTIRRYIKSGLLRCYRNPDNNYRMFNLEEVMADLRNLHIIDYDDDEVIS